MIAKYMLAGAAVIASLSMLWIAYTFAHPQVRTNVNYNHYVNRFNMDVN